MDQKKLIQRILEIDLSMPLDVCSRLSETICNNVGFQESLSKGNEELDCAISFYANLRNIGNGKKVSVIDYLKNDLLFMESVFPRHVTRADFGSWQEYSRFSTLNENKYCEQAREICQGKFGEIFQTVFLNGKNIMGRYFAFSGKADAVYDTDIYDSLLEKSVKENLYSSDMVVLIHNHPNNYKKTKVFSKRKGEKIGFVSNGSLSRADIAFTDEFFQDFTRGNIPVVMVAINEVGLTHHYFGGTSIRK